MPARQRWECLAWTALALAAAVAMEATGPGGALSFRLRLPAIIALAGGTWCAARWRRRVVVTSEEVIVRSLLRTRRVPRDRAMCTTARGTGRFLARARRAQGRGRRRPPATIMTPWVVATGMMVLALLTARVLLAAPHLAGAMIAVSAAVCLLALAASVGADRPPAARRRARRPRSLPG
jgi:hypothetical protein